MRFSILRLAISSLVTCILCHAAAADCVVTVNRSFEHLKKGEQFPIEMLIAYPNRRREVCFYGHACYNDLDVFTVPLTCSYHLNSQPASPNKAEWVFIPD